MSAFGKFKSFFAKMESFFKKMFGSVTWEETTLSVITFVGPILETLIGLAAGGPVEALVANAINQAKSDLGTLVAIVQGAKVAPGTPQALAAQAALNSIKSNLTSLIADANVKNSAKATEIQSVATLVINEVDAALEQLAPPTAISA